MTVPKWLIPALAAVAAIAVGVAAALFAVRFAAPEDVLVEPAQIEVPVLAPVTGDATLAETVAAEGDDIPISPTTAVDLVPDPAEIPEGALPADLVELLDTLDAADDPADVFPPGALGTPTGPAGDPCADAEAAGADCPEGAPGTILTLGGELPALQVWSDGGSSDACLPSDVLGTVRFVVRVNAPARLEFNVSQGDVREFTILTTPEQAEEWAATVPDETGSGWIEHCVEVADLRVDDTAQVYIRAFDDAGRRASTRTTLFVSDGLDVPPTRIHPLGESTVYASAPHLPGETVRMFALDAVENPECVYDATARSASFPTLREPHTEEVSAEFLADYSYEPDYTRRTTATFAVPPSTPMIICIGWFPATDGRPSYEQNTPLRVSEARLTSPDVVGPQVVVTEVETFGDVPGGSVRMRAATENGQACGAWVGPYGGATDVGVVLCDFNRLLGRYDADGAMLVTTEVTVPEGLAVNHVLLDVGLLSCIAGCAGETRSYDVPLSSQIRPARICSDDCRINVGESVGIVRLTATWPASAGTGEGWVHGPWREGAPVDDTPPTPRLDTREAVTVESMGFESRSYRASVTLRVDRPVTVVAEVEGFEAIPGLCPRAGATMRWEEARASTTHRVVFEGLCGGLAHRMRVTLTDAEGATATYGYERWEDGVDFWHEAEFVTPSRPQDVVVDEVRLQFGNPDRVVQLRHIEVVVGSRDTRITPPRDDRRCWIGDIHGVSSSGVSQDVAVGEAIPITVRATIREGTDPLATSTPERGTDCESGGWESEERLEFSGWISYEQLLAGPTVTLTDPDTGYTAVVVLSDRL